MVSVQREDASFRDPAGYVLKYRDHILRVVTKYGAADYEFVRDSGLLPDLIDANRVIGMSEIPPDRYPVDASNAVYLLEHPVLPSVSYPYEWCFSALKAAALLQLDLLLRALEFDVTLSDASAYNIQFRGPDPVFIDALSFRRYQDGDYWAAHQQFCEQFLNPLLLSALRGITFNGWYRGNLDGIRSEDLNNTLSWYQKLNWRVLTHVVLPVRFQSKANRNKAVPIDQIKRRRLPRASFRTMVETLRNWIAALEPAKAGPSTWRRYASDNSYDSAAVETKSAFTRRFSAAVKPKMLWDIGCNTGAYTEIAIQSGAQSATGFDLDLGAVEAAYARAVDNRLPFLPLVMDAANPSPGQGWLGRERKSMEARNSAKGLIAYAFVHHLSIARNVPLHEVITWLTGLAPQGVIEFVEKEDPMIQQMLGLREDIFQDYGRDCFLATIRKHAEIVETKELLEGRRLLVWYHRKSV